MDRVLGGLVSGSNSKLIPDPVEVGRHLVVIVYSGLNIDGRFLESRHWLGTCSLPPLPAISSLPSPVPLTQKMRTLIHLVIKNKGWAEQGWWWELITNCVRPKFVFWPGLNDIQRNNKSSKFIIEYSTPGVKKMNRVTQGEQNERNNKGK